MCGWKNTSAGAITAAAPELFVTKSSPNLANRHSTSFPPTDSSFLLITMKTNRPTSIPRVQTLFQAFALLLALALAPATFAQGITTSAITGFVTDKQEKPVAGAAITAVHEPSGTRATAVTRANGQYNLSGLRVGGPFTISASAKDLVAEPQRDVYLGLDGAQDVSFKLSNEIVKLESFSVSGSRDTTFDSGKIGSGSSFSDDDIANTASVRRNVQDIARLDSRLTLNSLDQGGQLSAQGQNFRFNSFLIDGVQANDTFGLNGNGVSSLRSPIPLDAIQSLSVDLSPYDVRRAGFTGALINAVTKSGSNQFRGSINYEYTDQDGRAKNPITGAKDIFEERSFNIGLSGPIIKNKVFFFLNYDDFKREASPPTANFVPDATQLAAIVARAKTLGYDAGNLDAVNTAKQKTTIAKIDWNVSEGQRVSFTYRKNDGTEPIFPSFTNTTQTSLSNYWYQQPRITESYTAQLFSTWTPDFRTEATVAYSEYDGSPKNNGNPFPEVTINGITGVRRDTGATVTNGSVRLGTEFSRQFNFLTTKNTNGTIVGEYSLGDHTLTFGGEADQTKYTNLFVQALNGSYTFNNITGGATSSAAWQAGTPITNYTAAAPFAGRSISEAYALWKYIAYGAFIQDSWKPNAQLTVNAGLRLDYPYVPEKPPYNAAFETAFGRRNDTTNDGNYTIAPRVGFNYNVNTKRKTQVRGGFGLFQGRNPAVWISNAYSNAGAIGTVAASNTAGIPGLVFEPNPTKQPVPTGNPPAPNINVTDKNFIQPAVWKANIALDHTLPFQGLIASVEFNFTETHKGANWEFLNFLPATTGPATTPDGRIRYAGNITSLQTGSPATSTVGRRRVTTFADVFLLKNSDKGDSQFATLSLNRPMKNRWAAGVSWTRGEATEVSPATSSTASSNYNLRAVYNPNEEVASVSNTSTKDKVVATFAREFEFVKNYKTTFAVVYEGRTGRPYSWVFRGDANGDGYTSNDLFYVPSGPTDSKVRFTSPAESAAFFAYVANTPGLNKYAGGVVARNADIMPWVNTIDLKITQEIPIYKNVKTELYLNVINIANLVDKKWGILDEVDFPYRRAVAGANYDAAANGGAGQYVYTFSPNTLDGLNTVANETSASRWQVLMGVRVKF